MESLDTMLSDAVGISALLSYDNKYQKFRQLKKQMSNISTPSPAASPEPNSSCSETVIAIDTLDNDVVSQTVLKTINNLSSKDEDHTAIGDLPSQVTIGAEFFSSSLESGTGPTTTLTVQSSSQLTCLTTTGKSITSFPGIFLKEIRAIDI